jgi:hypothetical protein
MSGLARTPAVLDWLKPWSQRLGQSTGAGTDAARVGIAKLVGSAADADRSIARRSKRTVDPVDGAHTRALA